MSEVGMTLVRPRTILVSPVKSSGFTKVGAVDLFVFYEDGVNTTMYVRVIDAHPTCVQAEVGKVYLTKPYRDEEFTHEGVTYHVMHEKFLEAEVEGYDEAAAEIYDEHEADGYPVCGKA